jgi:antitoxin (DNA-binding transcriptional repressor) of toxin-antitoxin stability system
VIAKAGRPVARLGPLARRQKRRRLGLLDGTFRVPDDFNQPLPEEVIAAFEGRRR